MKSLLVAVVVMIKSCVHMTSAGGAWLKEMENQTPGFYEGDIEKDRYVGNRKRSSLLNANWPSGVVPYTISNAFDSEGRNAIIRAIEDFHKYTCVKFIPRTSEGNYANFVLSTGGCSSSLGYQRWRSVNRIRLSSPCLASHGSILHEMSHTIGIHHEQTRADRDQYITVHEENIDPKYFKTNFPKLTDEKYWTSFNTPYDYASIMHYGATAFSTNGKITIETLDKSKQNVIGQRQGFSPIDVEQINIMYKCKGATLATVAPQYPETLKPGTPPPPPPPPTAPPPTTCMDDTSYDCDYWVTSGYCKLYADVREKYCCKSCKIAVGGNGNEVNKEGTNWRYDTRCGPNYKLENGQDAQCNPDAANPCCASDGWCGNRPEQCYCEGCKDYRVVEDEIGY